MAWIDLMFRFWHWWLKDNETAKTIRLEIPHVFVNFFPFLHSLKQRHLGRPRLARSSQNGTGILVKSELVRCSYDQKEPSHGQMMLPNVKAVCWFLLKGWIGFDFGCCIMRFMRSKGVWRDFRDPETPVVKWNIMVPVLGSFDFETVQATCLFDIITYT